MVLPCALPDAQGRPEQTFGISLQIACCDFIHLWPFFDTKERGKHSEASFPPNIVSPVYHYG
jgi:hypothetical protein